MSAASDQLKCFCKCYNLLEWKKTFNTCDSIIHVNEKPYSCGRCLKGFSPDDNVIVHKLIHTLNLLDSFNIFNKSAITKMHLTTYNIIRDSAMKFCTTKEGSNTSKEKHFSNSETGNTSSTSQNIVQCSKSAPCSSQTNKSLLTNNSESNEESPCACILCRRTFKWLSDLTDHLMFHVKEKHLFCCSECKRFFLREEHLASHMRQHNPELPYICTLCNNLFSNKAILSLHITKHIKYRYVESSGDSYSCKTCEKIFLSKEEVIQHLSVHATENPCHICKGIHKLQNGFAFFYCVHTEGKPYVCNVCRERFSRGASLQCHLRVYHGKDPYVCNASQEAYLSLDAHYNQYPPRSKSLPVCKEASTGVKDISDINEHNRLRLHAVTDGSNSLNTNECNRMCGDAVKEGKDTLDINGLNRTSALTSGKDILDMNEENRMSIDTVTDGDNGMCIDTIAEGKDILDINKHNRTSY